eukprot:gene8234-1470_t
MRAIVSIVSLAFAKAEYDPLPNPASVVVSDNWRVTVLTDGLVRVEKNSAGFFDDRPTFQVVNRKLPTPDFHVSPAAGGSSTQIKTKVLKNSFLGVPSAAAAFALSGTPAQTLTLTLAGSGEDCSLSNGTDWASPTRRSPSYPDGVMAKSPEACCAICSVHLPLFRAPSVACPLYRHGTYLYNPRISPAAEYDWVAYSYAIGKPDPGTCWPLASVSGSHSAPNRVSGQSNRGAGLSIAFTGPAGKAVMWVPGTSDPFNLNGTYPNLDCYSTPMELVMPSSLTQCIADYKGRMQPGLLSTAGWSVVDDAATARFVPAPSQPGGLPLWWSLNRTSEVDLYFMAFPSLDYKSALAQWISVLGRPAMVPRSALGVWWSRYYSYSQATIVDEGLQGYANYSIPLNNLVFDMDWHDEPKQPGCQSWGNYDVNLALFPDLDNFASSLHAHGNVTGSPLKLSFNVHPQTGVDHCDKRYKQFAITVGTNASTNQTVPCDFGNSSFFDTLMSVYWDAEPLHNVDMWWTDYNGCGVAGNNPLLWSNLAVHQHAEYARGVRGQTFSRYGGLGNHRYPHGFSGDTFQHEASLGWQVRTTQTAANALFGFWSHDIGGFHTGQGCPGVADPTNITGSELFLRWIQFGAVAPILRTHCSHCERRIWMFPYFEHMRDAMRLRNALVPYLYTAARRFYDEGLAPVRPLYHEYPADPKVYSNDVVERQYLFGDRILAHPVTTATAVPNGTVHGWTTYLPAGIWSDWEGTGVTIGPATVAREVLIGQIPLFINGGGPVPMNTMASVAWDFPDPLVWVAWPGTGNGTFSLYEDAGDSNAYKGGAYVTTTADSSGGLVANSSGHITSSNFTLIVSGAVVAGPLPAGFPSSRSHVAQLRGIASGGWAIDSVSCNGNTGCPGGWYITGSNNASLAEPEGSLVVGLGSKSSFEENRVEICFK